MAAWLAAVAIGLAITIGQYALARERRGGWLVVALRLVAVTTVAGILLDVPVRPARRAQPFVALDASSSMTRGGAALWKAALDSATHARQGTDSLVLFGDSMRATVLAPAQPTDARTNIAAILDHSDALGRPPVIVTDGETDGDVSASSLPAGGRVVTIPRAPSVDVAVTALDAPRAVVAEDTMLVRATVSAGNAASPPGTISLALNGTLVATLPLGGLPPFGSRTLDFHVPASGPVGAVLLGAAVSVPGDVEPRNDSSFAVVDRSAGASAVFVSTAPDLDARYALTVLRGALSIPTRAYFRVASGQWRVDGPLTPISESDVRAALRTATIAIVHGDTGVFGPPRALTDAPLALIAPSHDTSAEWYASAVSVSPLSAELSGVVWDSLAPVAAGAAPAGATWTAVGARVGRRGDLRPIVSGYELPRRVVVVSAGDLWRWQFRGGVGRDAFTALWGGVFDWLAAERADKRTVTPDAASFRAEEPIRWRRRAAASGGLPDTNLRVTLVRRGGTSRKDLVTLHFAHGATLSTSVRLAPGVYDVTADGGASVIAVSVSSELLPRAPRLRSIAGQGAAATAEGAGMRDEPAWFVFAVCVLCAEWLARRRRGLR